MMIRAMLWPTFALVALIFAVGVALVVQRVGHLRRHPPGVDDLADVTSTRAYFRPVEFPAANLANLFELPVLYFALVPLLLLTAQASVTQVILAWVYVALRAGHSITQLTRRVRVRPVLFMASFMVLSAMWLSFAIDTGFSPG